MARDIIVDHDHRSIPGDITAIVRDADRQIFLAIPVEIARRQ